MVHIWASFVRLAILLGGICLIVASNPTSPVFSDPCITIVEAPTTQQLSLDQNPCPDHLNSPARARTRQYTGQGDATLNTLFSGVYPLINVTWGGRYPQQFISYLDTGSSDTWVITKDYQCRDLITHAFQPQSYCDIGTLYDPDVGLFQNITDEYLFINYQPENDTLSGSMGYASISFGGLTIPKAEVAQIDQAAFLGDGITSGLVGLAYPSNVAAFYRDNQSEQAIYDPVFTTMVKEGIVEEAVFSIAIDRVPQGYSTSAPAGQLALGGLVSAEYYLPPFTSVPIEVTAVLEQYNVTDLSFYTTTVEFIYGLQNGSVVAEHPVIVFVPTAAADDLNAQFSPPAVYNETLGYWTVACDAQPPYAAYIVGGETMPMDPRDMIVPDLNGLLGYENVCFSAIADAGDPTVNVAVIGSVWQRSYVVAYDQGRSMMHFANRAPY